MWKYPPFINFFENILKVDVVSDVVLIDNAPEFKPSNNFLNNKKIQYITYGKNIFVNPAWNLGVERSKNKKIMILSDDVIFDFKLLYKIGDYITSENGAIGINPGFKEYHQPILTDGSIDIVPYSGSWKPYVWGFGALMGVYKDNWITIPEGLDFYYGDNWIYTTHQYRKKPNHIITNIFHFTPWAVTVDKLTTVSIKESEREKYLLEIEKFKREL